jgi:integrase
MKKAITKRATDALKPGEILADDQLPGFVVRRLPSKRLSYGYRFTRDGKRHWVAIGIGVAPEAARKAALVHAGNVANNQNPVTERAARRRKTLAERTVDEMLDGFVKARVMGLRTESEVISLLDRLVRPAIGKRLVSELRRGAIVEMLDNIADTRGARTSDKVLATLGTAFKWHALRDDTFVSPIVPGMARLSFKELSRDRILSDDEIRSLWAALDTCQPQAYGRLLRALLLAGCRLSEMAELQGVEIDGDAILVPASRVKTKVAHAIPITAALAPLLGSGPDYRFSTSGGATAISDFSRSKRRLDAAIAEQRARDGLPAMAAWRLHDLRRTARSLMGRAGVPSDHAERVLGHVMPGVRGIYDRHAYAAEKRAALEKLAALVESIINPPPANVVNLAARR